MLFGNTVRLKAEFRDYDGKPVDPQNVKVIVYNQNKIPIFTEDAVRESEGVYYYDYTITFDEGSPIAFEFNGSLDGHPVLGRQTLSPTWL